MTQRGIEKNECHKEKIKTFNHHNLDEKIIIIYDF